MRSARQLAFFADRLRSSRSLREYLDGFVRGEGLAAQAQIDQCFNFLRGAEYTFPQVLRALNDIADTLLGDGIVDYRVYAAQLQNLFLPGELRALDEFGVPIPLIQKASSQLVADDLDASLALLQRDAVSGQMGLSVFEGNMLRLGLGAEGGVLRQT